MVGGERGVPARELADRELQDLFYHRFYQFARGQTSRALIPASAPSHQRLLKNQALKKMEKDTGTLQQLMLRHFRQIATDGAAKFFSMPKGLFEQLRGQPLDMAIKSGLDTLQSNVLPIEDRRQLCVEPLPGPKPTLLAVMHHDQDDFMSPLPQDRPLRLEPVDHLALASDALNWRDGECVFFRVALAAPHRLKRPTRSVDNVRPDDVLLRLYRVCELSACNTRVSVQQDPCQDVWCTALMTCWTESDGAEFVSKFVEWRVCNEAEITLRP